MNITEEDKEYGFYTYRSQYEMYELSSVVIHSEEEKMSGEAEEKRLKGPKLLIGCSMFSNQFHAIVMFVLPGVVRES